MTKFKNGSRRHAISSSRQDTCVPTHNIYQSKQPLIEWFDPKKLAGFKHLLEKGWKPAAKAIYANPDLAKYAAAFIDDLKWEYRCDASSALACAIKNENSRNMAISVLLNGLNNGDKDMRHECARILWDAASEGADISDAVLMLGNALYCDDNDTKGYAIEALYYAAKNGADLSAAITALGTVLRDKNTLLYTRNALGIAMAKPESRAAATAVFFDAIMDGDPELVLASSGILHEAVCNKADISDIISAFRNGLEYGDERTKLRFVVALTQIAGRSMDISTLIPALVKHLENKELKEGILQILARATDRLNANYDLDISIAVPALGRIASDRKNESRTRSGAAGVLGNGAENGTDIFDAVSNLVEALKDEEPAIRRNAARALNIAAINGSEKTKIAITISINRLIQSKWMTKNAAANTAIFEEVSKYCAEMMNSIKQGEVSSVNIRETKYRY